MIILAIDPGVEKVGFSIFDKTATIQTSFKYITSGLIKTLKSLSHGKRLEQIYSELTKIAEDHKVGQLVMEQLFFFKNAKTVISVAQAQGVIELLAAKKNIPLLYLPPLQIKQILTGYGNADKQSVRKMIDLTLTEKIDIKDDDQSDAIACGLAYCYINESLL